MGRAKPQELETAAEMLGILGQLGLHFIALGEISSEDVAALRTLADGRLEEFVILDATNATGRSRFDTGIAYRTDVIELAQCRDIFVKSAGRTTRIGQYFMLVANGDQKPFHVIVSHWPSRLSVYEDAPKRIELGIR